MQKSSIDNGYNIEKIVLHEDTRGWFSEVLRASGIDSAIKQVSVASMKPGQIRGNHYHNIKHDWFFVFGGDAEFWVGDPATQENKKIDISENNLVRIHVLPKTIHAVKNISKNTIYFIEVVDHEYDQKNPDVVSHIICK
jgi:dTDP-4-dehydrorhamnose 3,5-epimerase-like enzyme